MYIRSDKLSALFYIPCFSVLSSSLFAICFTLFAICFTLFSYLFHSLSLPLLFSGKKSKSKKKKITRFFALIDPPQEMNIGAGLYYFENQREMERLMEMGKKTQKGQLFLELVHKVSVATDMKDKSAIIQLVCEGRTWKLRPETPESFNFWMETLETFVKREKALASKRNAALNMPVPEDF